MFYTSKHWDPVLNKCTLHGEAVPCVVCIDGKHPDVKANYPVQLSEDSPQKQKMMLDAYIGIVKQKLERKKLWRALIYWSNLSHFVEGFECVGSPEKRCVRAIRKAFLECDSITYQLAQKGLAKDLISAIFPIVLDGVLNNHEVADIMERVQCSPRSKAL